MTTGIVILNWNGRHFLEKYLPSVCATVAGMEGVRVIVADNGSDDGSKEYVLSAFQDVEFLPLGKNYGFAEGYNRALNKLEADCFLLLNSDVEVSEGWLSPLLEWMELHPECGICGPKIHRIDDRDCFEYAGAAGGLIDRYGYPFCRGRVPGRLEKDTGQYDIPADVLWVSGAALMIRSSVFFTLGGFCRKFFAHMEEIDLCWRARLEGWKVTVVPRSTVYHLGGGSLPQDSPYKLFLNYRNNLLMMARCLPRTYAVAYAFNLTGRIASPDEGPDMLRNCSDFFNENDKAFRSELADAISLLGIRKAQHTITKRMLLDGMSAVVYLFKGKPEYFRAVRNAHREFRHMREQADRKKIRQYIQSILDGSRLDIAGILLTDEPGTGNQMAGTFGLRSMWNRWTVWASFRKKDSIFEYIKETTI